MVFLASMAFIVYYASNLLTFLDFIKKLGMIGNLIFIVSYFPAGLPFALVSYYIPLSLSAGFLYGYYLGFATTMIGSVSSGMFGFWITRAFCRAWIEEKIKASARLSALLLSMEVHSFKITLMLRLLPLPFGLQNGLCAMTSITPPMYLLASAIGLLPENVLLIYFGNSFESITELARGDFGSISIYEKVFLGVALLVTAIIVLVGRRMLDATLTEARSSNKKTEDEELTSCGVWKEGCEEVPVDGEMELNEVAVYDNYNISPQTSFSEIPSKLVSNEREPPASLKGSGKVLINITDPPPKSTKEEKEK